MTITVSDRYLLLELLFLLKCEEKGDFPQEGTARKMESIYRVFILLSMKLKLVETNLINRGCYTQLPQQDLCAVKESNEKCIVKQTKRTKII